jgi:hypothetical protein
MVKIVKITLIIVFLCTKSYSLEERATCYAGECNFYPGKIYTAGQTNCLNSLEQVQIEQDEFGFIIIDTGEWCVIYNEVR